MKPLLIACGGARFSSPSPRRSTRLYFLPEPQGQGADRWHDFGITLPTHRVSRSSHFSTLNVVRDLVPAVTLFSSFIYAFAFFTVAALFYEIEEGKYGKSG